MNLWYSGVDYFVPLNITKKRRLIYYANDLIKRFGYKYNISFVCDIGRKPKL